MILFLDFDGVLHPLDADAGQLFCCAPHLWEILRRHPELEVVFSTAWRGAHPLDELRRRVTSGGAEDLAHRFIGVTPTLPETAAGDYKHRRLECEAWLAANAMEGRGWVAIDDMQKLWGFGESQNVYIVSYRHGLREHDVEAVSAMVRRMMR
jgi:hypothetical protein